MRMRRRTRAVCTCAVVRAPYAHALLHARSMRMRSSQRMRIARHYGIKHFRKKYFNFNSIYNLIPINQNI